MTQEDKELLLRDLCARLPYRVKCTWFIGCIDTLNRVDYIGELIDICKVIRTDGYTYWDCYFHNSEDEDDYGYSEIPIEIVKPYLRPMSSMTKEEKEEILNLIFDKEAKYFYIDEEGCIDGKTSELMKEELNYPAFCPINIVVYTDWLNAHHFDFHRLIEKGIALEASEDMYI